MLYSELVIRLLEYIAGAEGKHGGLQSLDVEDLVQAVGGEGPGVTKRRVGLAIEELHDMGLVRVHRFARSGLKADAFVYIGLDTTGPGLRFVEALRFQAKAEGKSRSWFWSGVEKAANLSQLVSLVIQAAAKAIG